MMRMGIAGLFAAGFLGAGTLAEAQEPAPVFEHLAGTWQGTGTLFGGPAEFFMAWERHDGLALLRFRNARVDSTGSVTPVLSAAAVYRARGEPEAVWLDSRGVRIEIAFEAGDSVLISSWRAPGEAGRTTYRVLPDGSVSVTDEVAAEDGFRTFGTATYRRF